MATALKNPGIIKFVGIIFQSDKAKNSWGWVEFPYDLKTLYGKGILVPAIISFDNIVYSGSIAKMGGKYPMLLIKREILAKLGKKSVDNVSVTVELDEKPRTVDLPDELKVRLARNPTANDIFNKLAYSHRKEYAQWIGGAKKTITRESRADKAVEIILTKQARKNS